MTRTDGPAPDQRSGGWRVHTATARGANHESLGTENQDSVFVQYAPATAGSETGLGVVLAVADGHGHQRHFRSGTGSRLAVVEACAGALRWWGRLSGATDPARVHQACPELCAGILEQWRDAVADDLARHPYTSAEKADAVESGSDTFPYGSTLLLAVLTADLLVALQIGDGDILAVAPDGGTTLPAADAHPSDGLHTTSLCQPDALDAFRYRVHDLRENPLTAVMLATDGYGNSQAHKQWHAIAGQDLAEVVPQFDDGWFAGQVAGWAQLCASSQGAGDDTTIALALNRSARVRPAA